MNKSIKTSTFVILAIAISYSVSGFAAICGDCSGDVCANVASKLDSSHTITVKWKDLADGSGETSKKLTCW